MTIKSKETCTPIAEKSFSLISNEKLIRLYAAMLQCRMLDESARILVKRRKFSGHFRSIAGQEAAIVGASIDLLPADNISPSDSDLVARFVKGVPLPELLSHLAAHPKMKAASSFSIGIATGLALAGGNDKNNPVTVSFCDNETIPSLSWRAALTFARTGNLPILFLCQSNPRAGHHVGNAYSCGVPGITVDANDVVGVYRVASEAIAHARKGHGPTLIECRNWRLNGRSLIPPGNQKFSKQHQAMMDNDPILNMERYLAAKGLFRKQLKDEIVAGFKWDLRAAIRVAAQSPARKRAK